MSKTHFLTSFLKGGTTVAAVATVCVRKRFLMMASSSANAADFDIVEFKGLGLQRVSQSANRSVGQQHAKRKGR